MVHRLEDLHGRLKAVAGEERRSAQERMRVLSKPRMTGGEGAAEVEAELRSRFESAGYRIRELPFSFSSLPGRFGVPALGGVHLIGVVLAVVFVSIDMPLAAVLSLVAALLLAAALFALGRTLIRRLPWGRIESANWLVTPAGSDAPRFLVVAHRDSKSQLVPIALRAAAGAGALIGWVALLILALVQLTTDLEPGGLAIVLGVVAAVLALPLLLSVAQDRSPGALDNASGLATLLGLADRLKDDPEVAFLVTDAEELGLAGASAVARQLPAVEGVINVDGIDDRGDFMIMERHGWPRRGSAPHLAAALYTAGRVLDMPTVRRDLPVGIQVDHVPLQAAGLSALTLMRGSMRSLWRVHLPADDAGRTTGIGVADAVALIDGALTIRRTPYEKVDGATLPEGLRPR